MYQYDTVSQAVEGLKKRGYTRDFNIRYDCLVCEAPGDVLAPEEFEITEVHRFEGNSDPSDEAVVYAIESHHNQKGILVNAYGTYADAISDAMVKKLTVKHEQPD